MSKADKTERTFIMVKVDGVQRGLVGEIIKRFEQKGYKLVALKFLKPSLDHVKQHYKDLSSKGFYDGLCKFMSSGPVAAMVWEGMNAVAAGRIMLGETDPVRYLRKNLLQAPFVGTIVSTLDGEDSVSRLILPTHSSCSNICHGSDSVESAQKEISLWFKEEELVSWVQTSSQWIYE
ncbi:Nucleoside diphosphate kinase B [Geodia barretti]|uniref:Nucleoside diphosphate kinase n=1 Tax=Geodia barretti TaxID=519541 RepID=A0AA35SN84_GEOBA|nr:Nucleoside diphosphate kinase B [Geodia barretti]